MGRIYKRGNIWYVDYSQNGIRVRKPISQDRKEAKQYLLKIEEKILNGEIDLQKQDKNLMEYIEERKEYFLTTRKPRYAKRCSFIFEHIKKYIQKENIKYVQNFKKEDAEKYSQFRLVSVHPKTVNDEIYVLKWIFESAKENNYILKNPLDGIRKLKYDPKPHRYFSDEELKIILDESPGHYKDMYIFLVNTGLRLGELEHLEWKDINLEKRLISVCYKNDWVPKSSQEREIPINKTLYALIEKLKSDSPNNGYLFNIQGRQPKEHLLENLKKILKKYGFEYGRLHTFRHTFGSKLAQAGVGVYEIQQLLGHSDIRMTQRYAKLSKENLEDAVRKLDG